MVDFLKKPYKSKYSIKVTHKLPPWNYLIIIWWRVFLYETQYLTNDFELYSTYITTSSGFGQILLLNWHTKRCFETNNADISTLTVSPCHTVLLPFSQSQGRFFISHDFTNFEQSFSKTHSFLKKQKQAAYSNVAEERISSMINKNNASSRSSLSLSWAFLFIMLVKTHIDNSFQWKSPTDLLKIAKKFTAE